MTPTQTNDRKHAALSAVVAVTEAIREAGKDGIPSGHLYAVLMVQGCSMQDYEALIRMLKRTGLVAESRAHLLAWTGPVLAKIGTVGTLENPVDSRRMEQ